MKFAEIQKLFDYCLKKGVDATIEPMFDGYAIRFNSGGDFIQHSGSYGHDNGCVEPAIGCRLDYTAVPLEKAKDLVRYHKDRLNKKAYVYDDYAEKLPRMVKVNQLADYLSITPWGVVRFCQDNRIPIVKGGKKEIKIVSRDKFFERLEQGTRMKGGAE